MIRKDETNLKLQITKTLQFLSNYIKHHDYYNRY